jgi:hypothetical protein
MRTAGPRRESVGLAAGMPDSSIMDLPPGASFDPDPQRDLRDLPALKS